MPATRGVLRGFESRIAILCRFIPIADGLVNGCWALEKHTDSDCADSGPDAESPDKRPQPEVKLAPFAPAL